MTSVYERIHLLCICLHLHVESWISCLWFQHHWSLGEKAAVMDSVSTQPVLTTMTVNQQCFPIGLIKHCLTHSKQQDGLML